MKFYFLLKNVPELENLTREDRGMVHRACYQQFGMRSWKIWVALVLYGLCGGFGVICGKWLFHHTPMPLYPALFTGSVVGIGTGFCLFRTIVIDCLRPHYTSCAREMAQARLPKKPH